LHPSGSPQFLFCRRQPITRFQQKPFATSHFEVLKPTNSDRGQRGDRPFSLQGLGFIFQLKIASMIPSKNVEYLSDSDQ
jgi:hypothetical protein